MHCFFSLATSPIRFCCWLRRRGTGLLTLAVSARCGVTSTEGSVRGALRVNAVVSISAREAGVQQLYADGAR
jgi:hypothetical protein